MKFLFNWSLSIKDYFSNLFETDFMPHGHCYFWKPEILWPNVIGDGFVFLSYFMIPLLLIFFIRRRKDIEFQGIFIAFAAFILFCGTTHLLAIISVWYPIYRLEAIMKVSTAAISVGTVGVLWLKMPKALRIPSPKQLALTNKKLLAEIDARKKAEEELEESEKIFRLSMSNAPIGMAIMSMERKWEEVNSAFCEMFGYTKSEIQKATLKDLTHAEDLDLDEVQTGLMLKGDLSSYKVEKRYKHKNGAEIWGLMSVSLVRDQSDNPIHFLIQILDITKRKNEENKIKNLNKILEDKVLERTEELELANKELESFSYSVSHDLKNPITAINLYASMLKEDYGSKKENEGLTDMANGILKSCDRMNQLINDIMEFSKAGTGTMEIKQIDMVQLFQNSYDELSISINKERVIEFKILELPNIDADEKLLRQVVVNLLSNALKYSQTKEKSIIEVKGWKEGDSNIYSVKDNGVGFDLAHKDKLFDAFERLDKGSEFKGTGVGLALTSRIIERHKGKIWADSIKDVETIFYFSLPS